MAGNGEKNANDESEVNILTDKNGPSFEWACREKWERRIIVQCSDEKGENEGRE